MEKIPLILLPGTLCDNQMWEYQINDLNDIASCTVMMLEENTIELMAKSVLNQAPDQFALAGFSMGGIVAIEIMRQAPERILKLALMDTNPNPPNEKQIVQWEKYIEMARNGQFSDITPNCLIPNMIRPECMESKEIVSLIIDMAENVGKEMMINQMSALISRPDGREVLASINCSTLLLTGRQDVLCTVEMHQRMKESINKSTLVVIENSGHMTTLEQPQEVTKSLRNWLLD